MTSAPAWADAQRLESLITALLAPPTETLAITPSSLVLSPADPAAGLSRVTSQTYTLTNAGSKPLNWSLINTSIWLNASATSGTLTPCGTESTVTVSLKSAATNFFIANFSGNIFVLQYHRRHDPEPAI